MFAIANIKNAIVSKIDDTVHTWSHLYFAGDVIGPRVTLNLFGYKVWCGHGKVVKVWNDYDEVQEEEVESTKGLRVLVYSRRSNSNFEIPTISFVNTFTSHHIRPLLVAYMIKKFERAYPDAGLAA